MSLLRHANATNRDIMAAHFTPELLRKAIDLQGHGWTQAEITQSLGVRRGTLIKHLTRHNQRVLRRLEVRGAF